MPHAAKHYDVPHAQAEELAELLAKQRLGNVQLRRYVLLGYTLGIFRLDYAQRGDDRSAVDHAVVALARAHAHKAVFVWRYALELFEHPVERGLRGKTRVRE